MKKLLLSTTFLLCILLSASAQDSKFTLGLGIGGSAAKAKDDGGKESGIGFNYYIDGMYNINDNLAVGVEFNANAAVLTDVDVDNIDVEVTAIRGILAKGKYTFGEGRNRPFVGLMAGAYTIQPGSITVSGTGLGLVFERKTVFGFAPQVGVKLGSFQLAASYHLPGKYKTEILDIGDSTPAAIEKTYSMLQFNIGWNIGIANNN